ncbi:adenylate kinase [candidate division KSB1 bacterium]
MRFVFLGAPGVGKGTQGDLIVKKLNIPKISTGDILREAIKNKTEVGLKAEGYVKSGELVPDKIIYELVRERLLQNDVQKGFIFDGFPRNIEQAEFLYSALSELKMAVEKVINIHVDELELIKRLSSRRICRKCGHVYNLVTSPPAADGICDVDKGELYQRPDDSEEVIVNRLEVYKKQTKPLIDYYSGKGILFNVEGSGNIDEINKNIEKILVN